jgi:hypothetical protein
MVNVMAGFLNQQKTMSREKGCIQLLQLRVFRFCFLQDGNIRIGVFPRGEEILVGGFRRRGVSLQGISAPQAQMRKRVFVGGGVSAAMVENLLIFGRRLSTIL